jgi:hypothetical protein
MRRWATVLAVLATWPLLTAGGGVNPPAPSDTKVTGPAVSAVVVVDTHNTGGTPTARQASIRLSKGTLHAGTVFLTPAVGFPFNFGCKLDTAGTGLENLGDSLTEVRFLGPLANWVPGDKLAAMFSQLGITISGTNVPVITDIDNDVCTPDNVAVGVLSFSAVVQFRVPQVPQN